MGFKERRNIGRLWHVIVFNVVLAGIIVLAAFTKVLGLAEFGEAPQIVLLVAALLILLTIGLVVANLIKLQAAIGANGGRLEKIDETLEKNRAILTQIDKNNHLSEMAKAIAFRDADRQALREVVFDKLQQEDFDTTRDIIDEIAHSTPYTELAKELQAEVERYRRATHTERIDQVIAHIEKLLDSYQWAKASSLIERLIKAEPDSQKAAAMRQRLVDKKQERKKDLLAAWDDAVKREATDRSLAILQELDLYLTPNEGLALQEAARDVFRTKLYNLGVQFSLAVSGGQWDSALQIGQQIARDFPNSRMAGEIRARMDILKQKVSQE